eukprot:gene19985-26699_t
MHPCVPGCRYIFSNETLSLDPPTLMAIRGGLAAGTMGIAWLYGKRKKQALLDQALQGQQGQPMNEYSHLHHDESPQPLGYQQQEDHQKIGHHNSDSLNLLVTQSHLLETAQQEPEGKELGQSAGEQNFISKLLNTSPKNLWLAGFEIGLWNTLGAAFESTGLQLTSATRAGFLLQAAVIIVPLLAVMSVSPRQYGSPGAFESTGLQLTSATRAGFLLQAAVIIVPLLAVMSGEVISLQVAGAVALGLLGISIVTFDGMSHAPGVLEAAANSAGGEALLLLACFFYSLSCVRIGKLANQFDAMELTAMEKFMGMGMAIVWVVTARASDIAAFFANLSAPLEQAVNAVQAIQLNSVVSAPPVDPMSMLLFWAVVVYTAVGPGAWASVLQTEGMRSVPATQTQLIFSLTPLWSALIAAFTVGKDGSEGMGPLSWLGAVIIVGATLLAARGEGKADQVAPEASPARASEMDLDMSTEVAKGNDTIPMEATAGEDSLSSYSMHSSDLDNQNGDLDMPLLEQDFLGPSQQVVGRSIGPSTGNQIYDMGMPLLGQDFLGELIDYETDHLTHAKRNQSGHLEPELAEVPVSKWYVGRMTHPTYTWLPSDLRTPSSVGVALGLPTPRRYVMWPMRHSVGTTSSYAGPQETSFF